MNHPIYVTKSDGSVEPFDESKLAYSLKKAGAPNDAIGEIIETVEKDMHSGISTTDIYRQAFSLLKHRSDHAAVRYSIRRAMFELGPEGFPFEKFVARIFALWGYEAITGQTLMGSCVSHEVDVVAWKGDELAMTEAKFHNEYGLKSDVKVALYVKSRFDDLAGQKFEYGGRVRHLTERFIFTNTKFTDAAIKYGECNGLKMVSWDHPQGSSLHNIIERNGLHPITCLTTLTHEEKRQLIGAEVITCADLIHNPSIMKNMIRPASRDEAVIAEAKLVIGSMQSNVSASPVSGSSIGLPR
jgi:hypothetical protein